MRSSSNNAKGESPFDRMKIKMRCRAKWKRTGDLKAVIGKLKDFYNNRRTR